MLLRRYEKSFEVEPDNTSLLVAEAFGIHPGWVNNIVDVELPLPLPQIVLIAGESGCGKSTLLRMLGEATVFTPPNQPLHAWASSDEEALRLLNSVGLNDASLFVLRYNQLSDSQQARARMYFWLCKGEKILIVDEFLSTLDRRTAQALAFSFQKMVRREKIQLIAATAHADLIPFLQPDLLVRGKAFPSEWTTEVPERTENPFVARIVVVQETEPSTKMTIGGTCSRCGKGVHCVCPNPQKNTSAGKDAYRESRLGELHYKGKYVGGKQEYISAKLDGEIVGWLVGTQTMGKTWRIARVVVHPTYRGCGVGQRLIRTYLALRPEADTVAAKARFNPVFERAGMKRVADVEMKPPVFLKDIPLDVAQWASKIECEKLMRIPKYHQLVIENADKLGLDVHPGGVKPGEPTSLYKTMAALFTASPDTAAQALWRVRPRRMAKYVGPKHKLYSGESDDKSIRVVK